MTSDGETPSYFAIHNTTRELGLNSTGGLFNSPPTSTDDIYPQGVYSYLAFPTGMKAGDTVKIKLPIPGTMATIQLVVMQSVTTPTINFSSMAPTDFYDTWSLKGFFTNSSISIALNYMVDRNSGMSLNGLMSISTLEYGLTGLNGYSQFNSTASSSGIINPSTSSDITDIYTWESTISGDTFTYNESGYYSMDLTQLNSTLGWIRLDSLPGSYLNFTIGTPIGYDISIDMGVSQVARVPDNFWNYIEDMGYSWNPSYYNDSTHIGELNYLGTDFLNITDFTRFLSLGGEILLGNSMFMAPPWIKEGSTFILFTSIPMLWPNNSVPMFSPFGDPIPLALPFRVTGAVQLSINGSNYDCWQADLVLPTGLSAYNITQFNLRAYFSRDGGLLMKETADLELTVPMDIDGDSEEEYIPSKYHKTWTIADMEGEGIVPPYEMLWFNNVYILSLGAYVEGTLDPSLFNGGSITFEFDDDVTAAMLMFMQLDPSEPISAYPVVKFMYIEYATSGMEFNATVNFYYTPTELSARGLKESGLTIYAYNGTGWEPLNTTVDYNGRVVSANTTYFMLFALVAEPLTIWDLLGPSVMALLLYYLNQLASPPMGGLMLPILGGIAVALVAVIAVAIVILARRH
nr:hypothetical protein [Candidatus Freyarchaeota archaeon]